MTGVGDAAYDVAQQIEQERRTNRLGYLLREFVSAGNLVNALECLVFLDVGFTKSNIGMTVFIQNPIVCESLGEGETNCE